MDGSIGPEGGPAGEAAGGGVDGPMAPLTAEVEEGSTDQVCCALMERLHVSDSRPKAINVKNLMFCAGDYRL